MDEILKVGMADMKVCLPPNKLTTLGLGSCVGIILYDPVSKASGLAHIMLPDSTKIKNNGNLAKFADTAIDQMIKDLTNIGARRNRLVSKIAGGAQMFSFNSTNDLMKVGERNIIASKAKLNELSIPILAEDTGENYGRTIEFDPVTGNLLIKTIGKPIKII